MDATPEALQVAKQHVVFAARAAGILPLGVVGSMADFGDEAAFREMVRRSRRFGFSGASCIHPAQVPILNELFAPSPEEVDAARRIVDALTAAEKAGRGAVALDGRMIDAPIAESARRTVQRQAVIEARSKRPAAA
jgi:citrate lyase subunit beta/citryl-CoA lyase